MKYHYNADRKEITLCADNQTLFSGLDVNEDFQHWHRWCVPYEFIHEIENLGYKVFSYRDFPEWHEQCLSDSGDDLPTDLKAVVDKITDSFNEYYNLIRKLNPFKRKAVPEGFTAAL
jgi:hypothetical protein